MLSCKDPTAPMKLGYERILVVAYDFESAVSQAFKAYQVGIFLRNRNEQISNHGPR